MKSDGDCPVGCISDSVFWHRRCKPPKTSRLQKHPIIPPTQKIYIFYVDEVAKINQCLLHNPNVLSAIRQGMRTVKLLKENRPVSVRLMHVAGPSYPTGPGPHSVRGPQTARVLNFSSHELSVTNCNFHCLTQQISFSVDNHLQNDT